MPEAPHNEISPRGGPLCPGQVAEVFLQAVPDAEIHRDALVDLARIAWNGEYPLVFYDDIAYTLRKLPWLLDHWVGQEVIDVISDANAHDLEAWKKWGEPPPELRRRTSFSQMEGLLLLLRLEAPDEVAAHDQLARILDVANSLLVTDLHGTAARKGRRHPLKTIFHGIGRPQTIEALAEALRVVVDKTWAVYPQVSDFLRSTYLPMVYGQPWTWPIDHGEAGLLGADKDPEPGQPTPPPPIPFEIQQPTLRVFTADDLVGEMAEVLRSGKYSTTIQAISPLWREENSWDFLEAVHRLSHTLPWLRPALAEYVDLQALQVAGQVWHDTQSVYAIRRAMQWRNRKYIKPRASSGQPALLASSNRDRRWGILHLRGLLLLGRMSWSQGDPEDPETALVGLIEAIERGVEVGSERKDAPALTVERHPLEVVLDRIGKPEALGDMGDVLESLMPEISGIDIHAARLLQDKYLPLLKGEPAGVARPTPSSVKSGADASKRTNHRRGTNSRVPVMRHVKLRIPVREKPLDGESPDEVESGQSFYRRSEPRRKAGSIKEEIQWIQHRIWGSNPLLIRNHIESLSEPETRRVVEIVRTNVETALSASDTTNARIGLIVALMLATGQGPETFAIADGRLCQGATEVRPRLSLSEGRLVLPVLRPESAFNAGASPGKKLLESTSAFLTLSLPPTICKWINTLLTMDDAVWQWEPVDLRDAVISYMAGLDAQIGTGISLSRLRNFAQANIRDSSSDLAMTMVLCCNSLGRSETPLFYYNASSSDLEEYFRKATWPMFGDRQTKVARTAAKVERVGSQLLVTQAAAKKLARSPSASLNAPSRDAKPAAVVVEHNVLTDHVLCMLLGAAGHRPTAALLRLTRFDFETDLAAAIFQDKKSDPVHFFRYVPVADVLAEQIDCYVRHLRCLIDAPGASIKMAKRVTAALHGHAPLFFALDASGVPVELELDTWRQALPEAWQLLPLNWGRTWLSSRGREAGIEADHLAIALGHLESVGYPFSSESPMEPAQLSNHMARPLGKLARESGWVVRKGLGGKADWERTILEAGPLGDWKLERDTLAKDVREFQVERRLLLRSLVRSKREKGEQIAHRELQNVVKQIVPTHGELAKIPAKSASGEERAEIDEINVEMTLEELDLIEQYVRDAAGSDYSLMISAHNALSRYLKSAQKKLRWRCPISSPWLVSPNMEPTPFFSGMFRANVQVRALRQSFGSISPTPPVDSGFNENEWAFGIAALALCVFSFEADRGHVRAILESKDAVTTSTSIKDLLLVETKARIGISGVRGLAAIAIARLKRAHAEEAPPEPERLDEVLAAMIPSALVGQPEGLLARLCATVGVSNLVELSGLARLANDPEGGCVAMPVARQRQFLEEGLGSPDPAAPAVTSEVNGLQKPVAKLAPSAMKKQYNTFRKILHVGNGPKKFSLTGESLSQANIGAFRNPLMRELEAFIAGTDLSSLIAYIASYSLHLTRHGTPEKSEPAWTTVYDYITSFGADLVELGAKLDFQGLDSDEYLDLYQDVIDRKTSNEVKALAARELALFHDYLEKYQGFDPVDFSALEGPFLLPEHRVDADLVQPQEALLGLRRMADLASLSLGSGEPEKVRLDRQAHVYALLLRGTGGRHNEIAALRFKDLLAHPDAIVVFARPSRYRRLKTRAARRIIDCTARLSGRERSVVSEWIKAEKSRLGKSWKGTLPIFSEASMPRTRVAHALLRDTTLDALTGPIGFRSKMHRVRHLVANEDLAELWLSDHDWEQLRRSRAGARRFVRRREQTTVVLPIHIRQRSVSLGHRRNSTTVVNYFHMPWMSRSRAHASLKQYEDRHAAAVALGIKVSAADKSIQRGKSATVGQKPLDKASIWLKSVVGAPTPTPGRIAFASVNRGASSGPRPISARLVDRVLRDIQKGSSPDQAAMAHGLNADQRDRLVAMAIPIQKKTGFTLIPVEGKKQGPRSARRFQSASVAERLLRLMDEGERAEVLELVALSSMYLMWAQKSRRDEIIWPANDVGRMVGILSRVGIEATHVLRTPAPDAGFERLVVLRRTGEKEALNHLIAWSLVVIHVTKQVQDYEGIGE